MLKVQTSFTQNVFEAFLLKAEKHIIKCMGDALAQLVRESDTKARDRGYDVSFRDVTGNLRSSIGGAVYQHGQVFFTSSFNQVLKGSKGSAEGRKMVQSLAHQYTDAIVMVMVAGMDYADYVEAIDSKDVIESTRIWAESVVMKRLEEAKDKAVKEINSWSL